MTEAETSPVNKVINRNLRPLKKLFTITTPITQLGLSLSILE